MKSYNKLKLIGNVLSDGSLNILLVPRFVSGCETNSNVLDIHNHIVWTGKRTKEQTEISIFVDRFRKSF
uniref:ribosomal protein L31 n=1 Tax=Cutleria multifida TaxID=74475 RepID=UPI002E78EEC8|nr:ribosomal protein L31 [Cutleria multifida]WBP69901.1 ribosomal protein L31 [Cutleria multifida]